MPLPAWRHVCICLALAVLGGVVWVAQVARARVELEAEARAAIVALGAIEHDEPALPQAPSSDREPGEGELDGDTEERMAPVSGMTSIPPAGCAGLVSVHGENLRTRIELRAFERPPRT